MIKNRILALLIAALVCSSSWADQDKELTLNKVSIQLQAEKWIETQTALVSVSVDAALSDQNLIKMQNEIMQQLQQLAKSDDWRIVSLSRRQDNSGLESVQITAQARLNQSDLTGIRERAKSITKPGKTFKVSEISFSPSEADLRAANSALREDIYKQARDEASKLNATYPDQSYFVHQVDFMGYPGIMRTSSRAMLMAKGAEVSIDQNLSVDNKAQISARVVLGSIVNKKVSSNG